MQRLCQDIKDIMPRTLTRQIKNDDVKLKHMTSLIGFALRYFARDVKLMAAAGGFLKSPILFYSYSKPFSTCKICLHQHYIDQIR